MTSPQTAGHDDTSALPTATGAGDDAGPPVVHDDTTPKPPSSAASADLFDDAEPPGSPTDTGLADDGGSVPAAPAAGPVGQPDAVDSPTTAAPDHHDEGATSGEAGEAEASGSPPAEATPPTTAAFASLGLRDELLAALAELGYDEPTPIQREAIPHLIKGRDLLGQAATGTGKTAAFALPILQRLAVDRGKEPSALVLVPTRELAIQVSEALHRYGRGLDARVLAIYGGQPIVRQLRALARGVDVVVATPGRAIDHLNRGSLQLDHLAVVVLDEADEMLDMGFAEDIDALLTATPRGRQTVLFSATLPPRIDSIARRHQTDPVRVRIAREDSAPGEGPLVRQVAYVVARFHKARALARVLDVESPQATLVFCRTREDVDHLTETLNGRGYRAEALHGGMSQEQRDRVMGRLRGGTANLLVATDVAARGLDVDHLSHVVNYDVPSGAESYVHRIGRVGRAGRLGVAITLVEPREHRMLKVIERTTGQRIQVEKVPTAADLRTLRLEATRAALEDAIRAGELDGFAPIVEALAAEFDVAQVALAAVRLLHEAGGNETDGEDIPDAQAPENRKDGPKGKKARGKDGGPTGGYAGPERNRKGAPPGKGGKGRGPAGGMTRLFVSAGHNAGIRPQDLVGAIANESNLTGKEIGSIQITDNFSLVEVPDAAADAVISALRGTTIKGKRATVRRERYERR